MLSIKFVVIFLIALFLSCEKSSEKQTGESYGHGSSRHFASFRDIPGVTDDEIKAIEALQAKTDHFIFGMPLSTEIFIDIRGD
jgi:hypothetical protein